MEFQSPDAHRAVAQTRSPATLATAAPVTFPESYPFSLVAHLPGSRKGSGKHGSTSDESALFNPGLGETAIVFLALVLASPTKHIMVFLESMFMIERADNFAALLSQFFKVATSILSNFAFPKTWLNVNVLAHKVLIKIMEPISVLLQKEFIPSAGNEAQFDAELWREAFFMLLKLLSSDQLVIEEFSAQKSRAVWRLGGDIRGEGAAILLRLWESLGPMDVSESGDESLITAGVKLRSPYLWSLQLILLTVSICTQPIGWLCCQLMFESP
jgi:hypothetical protein